MPTVFTHAVAALALGSTVRPATRTARFWLLSAAGAVVPDLDVLTFRLGIPYEHPLGHRGFSHSFVFAAGLAALVVAVFYRRAQHRTRLGLFFFAATASHGLLDMLTDGGRGVALLAPFSNARLFFPWRLIRVSPIGAEAFFSARGLEVLWSEVAWVWLPALALGAATASLRRRKADPGGTA